ncbi:MAG: NADH-quinone oxidoreductase subunit C [Candidatus Poribacteria bacterium]|nr:NADH-quinone oxidoreductase subunit C [Candidatus Poribacteria bacterium]
MSEEKEETPEEQQPLVVQKAQEKYSDAILEVSDARGELTIVVRKDVIHGLMEFLKNSPELVYDYLVDVTAVDYSLMEDVLTKYDYARFMVVYHLYSHKNRARLRVKVPVHEKELHIPSMASLWRAANWLERETYDMFGITFDNHPDLRRILMPDDYEGHPLRKDYPLRGRGERESFNFERQNA